MRDECEASRRNLSKKIKDEATKKEDNLHNREKKANEEASQRNFRSRAEEKKTALHLHEVIV